MIFTLDELEHLKSVKDYAGSLTLSTFDRDRLLEEYWIQVRVNKTRVPVRCQFCHIELWAHAYHNSTFYRHGQDEQVYKAQTPYEKITKNDTHSLMLWLNGLHARELVG